METCRRIEGIADFIACRYESAVEIGVGHFPDVAFELLRRRVSVFATDIRPFRYTGLNIIVDDVTEPDVSLYRGIKLIYSMRPPPELIPYIRRLASMMSADVIIKPLSDEYIDGYKLMQNENVTFFHMKNNDHLQTLNSINVIPACLESFLEKNVSNKSYCKGQKDSGQVRMTSNCVEGI